MNSTDSAADVSNTALSFPLQLNTHAIDAGSIVIEADLSDGTLALLAGADNVAVNIDSPESYEAAAEELAKVKAVGKRIDEQRKAITKPLDDERKRVMDYARPFTDALARVEADLKSALITFDQEQERKRKLAEAEAAERQRKQAEALEKRADKAEASGKLEKADALREQATTAVFAAPAPPVSATPKVTGLSSRKTYSAEVTDLMELAKAAVAKSLLEEAGGDGAKLLQRLTALAFKGVPLRVITPDSKVLGQQATSLKEDLDYPGVKLVTGTSLASRSKK